MTAPASRPRVAIFDLGGVLIDWNPRYLYRKLLPDEAAVERFLAEVCTLEWNFEQDRGRTVAEATAWLQARQPAEHHPLIAAYYGRFAEMIPGAIDGTVAILERLHAAGVPLYAITNWSAETFSATRPRFPFLERFRQIAVSGELKIVKPDPRIFGHLCDIGGFAAADSVFIDDNTHNVEAALALGMAGIRFEDPVGLERELTRLGLLP